MVIQEQVLLRDITTFRLGGPAQFCIIVENEQDLLEACTFAHKNNLPLYILGEGSNVVFGDAGYNGVILLMSFRGIDRRVSRKGTVEVVVGAGEKFDDFVSWSVSEHVYGLENLSGIPGTVGAAPIQNIGAYGTEVSKTISWVEAIHLESGEKKIFQNKECAFGYRTSIFNTTYRDKYIITRVCFTLSPSGSLQITYKDLVEYFKHTTQEPTIQSVREAVLNIRIKKFPDLSKVGTAGSFFKNPVITKEDYRRLQNIFPELPCFSVDDIYVKVPLAFLLEALGYKGKRVENVGVHHNHALVLVHYGGSTTHELITLTEEIKRTLKEKTGITIKEEVQLVM